jgi:hypothetical protein
MRNLFIAALMGIAFSGCGSVAREVCRGDLRNQVVCPGILDNLVEDAAKPATPAPSACKAEWKGGELVLRHCSRKERKKKIEEYFSKK